MKKFIIVFLIVFVFIGLVGCVSDENPKDKDDDTNQNIDDELPNEENPDEEDPKEEDPKEEPTEDELIEKKVEEILETLSIEDKIGQMFMVGFFGTSIPSSLRTTVKEKRFGNFIYFGENVANDALVPGMSETLQNIVTEEIGIPAFISMDQEGGAVVRFANNATHFIGAMGLVATNNVLNAYNTGLYNGRELRHYGVNNNLAPVLDVNNNPANPVIGIRSFSDDPDTVSSYGIEMFKGLKESKVLSTEKHFPGHGDTRVDSHYGLPLIPHDKERLYEVELAPFIDAIEAGVDSIMSAHIVFPAFDDVYPATLSHKVLTGLLREELGFDGIIMSDEMRMQAIRNNFGVGEAAVKAILAGVDILLYAESTSTSLEAHAGVLEAVNNGTITEERLNESVRRILEKKLKYDVIDEDATNYKITQAEFDLHSSSNKELVRSSVTLAKGNVDWFDKNKSTLIISTVANRHPLVPGYKINTSQNSFANVGKNYLFENGVSNVASYVIGTSINTDEMSKILNLARKYDQVIIGVENVSASQASLINLLSVEAFDLLVSALRNPYDYLSYNNIDNYICTYGYYSEAVYAIFDILLGDLTPTGVLPVKVDGLNN